MTAAIAGFALATSACAGGARPVLVNVDSSVASVAATLPPAPAEAPLVGAPNIDAASEPEVDDALFSWANSVGLAYTGDCAGTEPTQGLLCGRAEGVGSIYLVGPSATDTWYVVSIEFTTEGYRVTDVALAGT